MRGLESRHFLVTGGGSGIGRRTAEHLLTHGARVSVLDRDGDAAAKVVRGLDTSGTRAVALPCDVTYEGDLVEAIGRAEHALGDLAGAVTSAGINPEADRVPLADMTLDAFERVLSVNLAGSFLVARHVIPRLVGGGGGAFVFVSSTAGLRGGMGQGFGYTASKGGLVALAEHLASIFGKSGVRVNCVCPGATAGEGMGAFFQRDGADALVAPRVPLARVGQAEEVGAVIAWLLSDEASYVTGQAIAVDGGATAR
jgi:NAD(P)-dependent dehydrogenase (short-subunit alcohol dehydrogenase family)